MDSNINLMMFFDDRFFKSALVCLSSIIKNTKHDIDLYFDGELSDENFDALSCYSSQLNIIKWRGVIQSISNHYFLEGSWLPPITLNRLFGPYHIANNIDRLIYLDADIVVVSDLFEFQQLDLKDNVVGASGESYFNAGVILYDMRKLLEQTSEEQYIEHLKSLTKMHPYADQDILNIFFKENHYNIGSGYNYRAWNTFLWKNPLKHNAKIIHYLGRIKPDNYKWIEWKANKPFWKYAKPIYGMKYRIKIAIKSFFWYPIALYRRFWYHTGAKD